MQKTSGQVAFEAYTKERGGKNHDGTSTPGWEKLGVGVRKGWEAAALAAQSRYVTAEQWEALDAAGKVHEGYIAGYIKTGLWAFLDNSIIAAAQRGGGIDWCVTTRFRSEGGQIRRIHTYAPTLPEVTEAALRVLHGPWRGWG